MVRLSEICAQCSACASWHVWYCSDMNNNKKNPIVVGIAFIIAGPMSAFCGAAVFALSFGLSFNVLFYSIWGVVTFLGVLSIVGGIMEAVKHHREANS